jgi:GDP-L-fucose synthase
VELVFGGDSFVARNLSAKNKISKSECDLTSYDEVISVLKHFKPGSVINCAAAHGSATAMNSKHSYYLNHNLTIDSNLLKACHTLNIENVVLLSSVSAFPSVDGSDVNESNLYSGEVNNYNFGYNTAKRISYELCKAYELDFDRNYKVLFLGNLYGKYGNYSKDSNVLNSIIFQISEAMLKNEDLTLYGTGDDQRAFTLVEDLNEILNTFIQDKNFKSAIFSSSEVYTIKEIATLVSQKMGYTRTISFNGSITAGQKRKVASSKYLLINLPDFKFTPLEVGLDTVVKWYKSFI